MRTRSEAGVVPSCWDEEEEEEEEGSGCCAVLEDVEAGRGNKQATILYCTDEVSSFHNNTNILAETPISLLCRDGVIVQ